MADQNIIDKKINEFKKKRNFEKRCNNDHNVRIFSYFISELEEIKSKSA